MKIKNQLKAVPNWTGQLYYGRPTKEILTVLLTFAQDYKDTTPENYTITDPKSFCRLTKVLKMKGHITREEEAFLDDYIRENGPGPINNFQWPQYDWGSRVKWLEDQIKSMPSSSVSRGENLK